MQDVVAFNNGFSFTLYMHCNWKCTSAILVLVSRQNRCRLTYQLLEYQNILFTQRLNRNSTSKMLSLVSGFLVLLFCILLSDAEDGHLPSIVSCIKKLKSGYINGTRWVVYAFIWKHVLSGWLVKTKIGFKLETNIRCSDTPFNSVAQTRWSETTSSAAWVLT